MPHPFLVVPLLPPLCLPIRSSLCSSQAPPLRGPAPQPSLSRTPLGSRLSVGPPPMTTPSVAPPPRRSDKMAAGGSGRASCPPGVGPGAGSLGPSANAAACAPGPPPPPSPPPGPVPDAQAVGDERDDAGPGALLREPVYNWQATKPTVQERFAFLFNNEVLCDVHFLVGKGLSSQRVPAHRWAAETPDPATPDPAPLDPEPHPDPASQESAPWNPGPCTRNPVAYPDPAPSHPVPLPDSAFHLDRAPHEPEPCIRDLELHLGRAPQTLHPIRPCNPILISRPWTAPRSFIPRFCTPRTRSPPGPCTSDSTPHAHLASPQDTESRASGPVSWHSCNCHLNLVLRYPSITVQFLSMGGLRPCS